jgi:ribose transport system substrate-binding protein
VLKYRPAPSFYKQPSIASQSAATEVPDGFPPAWYNSVTITPAEVKQVCAMHLTAAFLNWSSVVYNQAIANGIRDSLAAMNIKLVAQTDFSLDPAGLSGDVSSILALRPDIVFAGGTTDPNQAAAALAPVIQRKLTLVMFCEGAAGYSTGPGAAVASVICYNPYALGASVADAMHKEFPKGASIGFIHWITTNVTVHQRDQGFLDELKKYPNLKIVANEGMPDPNTANTVAQAMITRYPQINAVYAPWEDPPAVGIEAGLESAHATNVKIFTMDLGPQGASDMAHGGQIAEDSAEDVYDWGVSAGIVAALNAIHKPFPKFLIAPVYAVTASNLVSGYNFMHGPELPLPAADVPKS